MEDTKISPHPNELAAAILRDLDLGASVAETDQLLEVARVETSAFSDLLRDRVDLVPGTKGSGKSALFRIFVQFLPDNLLESRRVVVAHGVDDPGDPVFQAFKSEFEKLTEDEFVSFWCIYLVSLAHEQFIKGPRYADYLADCGREVAAFREACAAARIPEIQAKKSLKSILQWTLTTLRAWSPKVTYTSPIDQGTLQFELQPPKASSDDAEATPALPSYVADVRRTLEAVLQRANLSVWLMIDRLDEVFPRRSHLERVALRGLLRSIRIFSSDSIRVKVFLRDDMLESVVRGEEGFTALTHVTSRQSDTLRWTERQILTMLVKRIYANNNLRAYLRIDTDRLEASAEYREEAFYRFFPPQVHKGKNQSPTLKWIYNRCSDGRGVVTPRDVLDLVIRSLQRQQDVCNENHAGSSESLVGRAALQYGLEELSKKKRTTYLEAEFPHLWVHISKLVGGKTEYQSRSLEQRLGRGWEETAADLVSIGLLEKSVRGGQTKYRIPFLYRRGLELTQGTA